MKKTYESKRACRRCENNVRYLVGDACVKCSSDRQRERNLKKRIAAIKAAKK